MDLEFFFLLENIVTIILGLLVLVIGFRLKNRLYSNEARERLMANWSDYSIGIFLFGAGLFIYLISEFSRFIDPYSSSNLEVVHEWGEMIHMLLIMFAMALSLLVAVDIGRGKR